MKNNYGSYRWKTVFVLLLLSLCLTACGGGGKAGGAGETTELTVLLDWYPNAPHTFLYAAEEQGYFQDAGLKVNLKIPASTDDALKLAATGKADIVFSYQMQVAIARAEDIPVKSVGAIVRHPLNQLFVTADSGIQSPKDLVGKKIGFPSLPLDEALVKSMVEGDGGDASKLDFIDIGWDLIPAISTNRVDAIIGGYINHEKLLLEREGIAITAFDPSQFGVPDYYELVAVAGEDTIDQKGDAIKAFWEAAVQGQEYVAEHPDESLDLLLKNQSQDFALEEDVEKESLNILLPLMAEGDQPFADQSEDVWQSVIDWLKATGTISKDLKASDMYVNL